MVAAVTEALRRAEPQIPLLAEHTAPRVLDRSVWGPRLAAAFLALVGAVATLIPARRATSVDPNAVPRSE